MSRSACKGTDEIERSGIILFSANTIFRKGSRDLSKLPSFLTTTDTVYLGFVVAMATASLKNWTIYYRSHPKKSLKLPVFRPQKFGLCFWHCKYPFVITIDFFIIVWENVLARCWSRRPAGGVNNKPCFFILLINLLSYWLWKTIPIFGR